MSDPNAVVDEITWTIWPEDILDALDMLLVYLGVNKSMMRSPIISPINHRKPQENQVPMRRALGSRAVQAAVTLLYPIRRHPLPNRGIHWCISPRYDHRDRLASAGIDMDTVQVIDRKKFAFAWAQLISGWTPYYSREKQDKALSVEGAPVPPLVPFVKRIPKKPARETYASALQKVSKQKENWSIDDGEETLGQMMERRRRGE